LKINHNKNYALKVEDNLVEKLLKDQAQKLVILLKILIEQIHKKVWCWMHRRVLLEVDLINLYLHRIVILAK
jgi:hypothetical protein